MKRAFGWILIVLNILGLVGFVNSNPDHMILLVNSLFEAFGLCIVGLIGVLLVKRSPASRAK